MLSNDNNNRNNREQFSSDSVVHFNEQVSKFAFSYTGRYYYYHAPYVFLLVFVLSFTGIITIIIIISCNKFNLSLKIDERKKALTRYNGELIS